MGRGSRGTRIGYLAMVLMHRSSCSIPIKALSGISGRSRSMGQRSMPPTGAMCRETIGLERWATNRLEEQGIPYLAMLVRPAEVRQGEIRHALSLAIPNTDGYLSVAPATKLEFPGRISGGIPEGTRFALSISESDIDDWIHGMPEGTTAATKRSAAVIARALRDYGCFVTDTAGSAHLQFESMHSAGSQWEQLGLGEFKIGEKVFPRDLLDGLITPDRIYALASSDQYPERFLAHGRNGQSRRGGGD